MYRGVFIMGCRIRWCRCRRILGDCKICSRFCSHLTPRIAYQYRHKSGSSRTFLSSAQSLSLCISTFGIRKTLLWIVIMWAFSSITRSSICIVYHKIFLRVILLLMVISAFFSYFLYFTITCLFENNNFFKKEIKNFLY